MSSIWSSAASQASASPFGTTGMGPTPGGGAATKFQSILQSSGNQSASPGQLGLSASASAAKSVASPMDTSTSSGSSSTSDAMISANDFLSLLVTEMQNQDPTADTDPNAYVDQLVQINSLEQLISINQNLSTALGVTPTSSVQGSPQVEAAATPSAAAKVKPGAESTGAGLSGNSSTSSRASASAALANGIGKPAGITSQTSTTHGNLSLPSDHPAAHSVARALNGKNSGAGHGHAIRDIPTRSLP